MENLKITRLLDKPMYRTMSQEQLNTFFATGYQKTLKERCMKNYTMFDFKQGILEANTTVKTDINRHTVDLMLFALAKIEELETDVTSYKETVSQLEKQLLSKEEKNSKNKDKKEVNKNEQ